MICPSCNSEAGHYVENLSYELGDEDWGYYSYSHWQCQICQHVVHSYDDEYEPPDD